MKSDIADQVRQFIINHFLAGDAKALPPDDASLFDRGIIVSLNVLELILFLEEQFEIVVNDEDVVPENFASVETITTYIQSKLDNK